MTRISISLLYTLLSGIFVPLCAQNALLPSSLMMTVEHQLEEVEKHPDLITIIPDYTYYEILADEEPAFLIWRPVVNEQVELYEFPIFFTEEISDIFKIEKRWKASRSFDLEVVDEKNDSYQIAFNENTEHSIRSLIFFENWNYNTEENTFNKEVYAYVPVRFIRSLNYGANDLTGYKRVALGVIRFPEKIRDSYNKRRNKKKLVPLLEMEYEFLMVDTSFLEQWEEDWAHEHERGPSPYFLKSSYQWNHVYADLLLDMIFKSAFSGELEVLDGEDGTPVTLDGLHKKVFPPSEFDAAWSVEDFDSWYTDELKTEELQDGIYSLIFEERWSMDPETLYIRKEVRSLTPVKWMRYNEDQFDPRAEPAGDHPRYIKRKLFTLYFD